MPNTWPTKVLARKKKKVRAIRKALIPYSFDSLRDY